MRGWDMVDTHSNPLVSVVTPSYNAAKYIKRAIDSIMAQTYTNFEYYITDDGSTDGTRDIIEEALRQYGNDERIHFLPHQKNTGFAWQEEILSRLKGKYICMVSGDDACFPEKIERQVVFLENNKDEYVGCFTWIKAEGEDSSLISFFENLFNVDNPSRQAALRSLLAGANFVNAPSAMIRMDVFRKYGGYNFKFRQAQDYDLWLKILLEHNLAIIPEKLTVYTARSDSLSSVSDTLAQTLFAMEREEIVFNGFLKISDELFMDIYRDDLNKLIKESGLGTEISHLDILCLKLLNLFRFNSMLHYRVAARLYYIYADDSDFNKTMLNRFGRTKSDIHKILKATNIYNNVYASTQTPDPEVLTNELMDIIEGKKVPVTKEHIVALYSICALLDNGRELFRETVDALSNNKEIDFLK
jgi:glycosyltransferase involved in cell wall biosynthesis